MDRNKEQSWVRPLLAWYGRERRPLPWRLDPTPYRVWVGEVMSQQTTLGVVVPRFEPLVRELPCVEPLATCRERDLRRLWAGLGYYARARNLRRGARLIAGDLGGLFPDTYEGWLAIPGCGPYTAAMVSSMCFGERVPAVDGNVVRVTSRLTATTRDVWSARGQRRIRDYLEQRIPARSPGDFNQALMELGQQICTKANPGCGSCPLGRACRALERGIVDRCPPARPRRKPEDVGIRIVVLSHVGSGRVLLCTRRSGFLAHTKGFPILGDGQERTLGGLGRASSRVLDRGLRHTITHHRISARVVAVALAGRRPPAASRLVRILGAKDTEWVPAHEVEGRLSSSLDRKALGIFRERPPG